MKTSTDIIKKYQGKRVRINGRLYIIDISDSERDIVVNLHALRDSQYSEWDVSTYMTLENFPDANPTIKKAITFVHKIADEIEENLEADIEIQ